MLTVPLTGQVSSKIGRHLTIISETGRVFKISVESTTLELGDEVFLMFDYINDKIKNILRIGECEEFKGQIKYIEDEQEADKSWCNF